MDLLKMLQDLVAKLSELQAQLADVPAALEAAKKLSYDEGFVAGVASVPVVVPGDKIFSQAELDAKIAEVVAPLEKKVSDLELVVAGMDQKVLDAVMAAKADLLAKIKDLELKEESDLELLFK
jgi:hypothetical protein